MGIMKVHQLARAPLDKHEPSLSLGCKRFLPLAPKHAGDTSNILDVKNYVKPNNVSNKLCSSYDIDKDSPSVESPTGGTRWNPTQEQIGILEMLYKGGMRTPNAQKIEQITAQLVKYGKIEGKNVFYWFQNHKARERQKQKRSNLGSFYHCPTTQIAPLGNIISLDITEEVHREEDSPYKKRCKNQLYKCLDEESISSSLEEETRTLELFPLHPEAR